MGEFVSSTGIELPPVAPLLMQSLRAVGYTTAAALADLIDNSVAAKSELVAIRFGPTPESMVAVIDNGEGMDGDELIRSMRFGSKDPRELRTGMDLGRFGLGLKTASLSQCRRLTVASLKLGNLSIAEWDLDECERRNAWWLATPDASAVPPELLKTLNEQGQGTAVIWRKLDRMLEAGPPDVQRALDQVMDGVADHLAMVFHRFLAGEFAKHFDITVNNRSLPRFDPFLEGHARGQTLHSESFKIEGHAVVVSPFVLPFPSRLQSADMDRAGGREGLKTGHGFYVYRGGRLVVPGGWFRIVPSDELIRLARVRVDVPVELDHLWKVDIRKTVAEPPAALRPELKRIVGAVTLRSRRVYTHKGTRAQDPDRIPLWSRLDLRDGAARWAVNRQHPAVAAALGGEGGDDMSRLLKFIEEALPVHEIHLHLSNDLPLAEDAPVSDVELETLARRMIAAFADEPDVVRRLLERLPSTDPFSRDPDKARALAERLK
jgi:hypothetical protein